MICFKVGHFFYHVIKSLEILGHFFQDVDNADGPSQWMEWWTIFYWGWWIAWCPFVGEFSRVASLCHFYARLNNQGLIPLSCLSIF